MRAFELIRDIPMLRRGSVFVYDEKNESGLGSPGSGCLMLAWNAGQCGGVDGELWCGGAYVLPGQCHRDETWFAEVPNPQIETSAGLGPQYYVTITKHVFSRVR